MNKALLLLVLAAPPAHAGVMIADDSSFSFDLPRGWRLTEPTEDDVVLDARRKKSRIRISRVGDTEDERSLRNRNLNDLRRLGEQRALISENIDRHVLPSKDILRSIEFEIDDRRHRTGYFNFGSYAYAFFSYGLRDKDFDYFIKTIGHFPRTADRSIRPRPWRQAGPAAATEEKGRERCLDQIQDCFAKRRDLVACIEDATRCPDICRMDFATLADSDLASALAFQRVFQDPQTRCSMAGGLGVASGGNKKPAAKRPRKLRRATEVKITGEKVSGPVGGKPFDGEVKKKKPVTAGIGEPGVDWDKCVSGLISCNAKTGDLDRCMKFSEGCPKLCVQLYESMRKKSDDTEAIAQKLFLSEDSSCRPPDLD